MSFVTLGTVSNGFGPLVGGSSLLDQCRRALERGYGYVELRQGSLGKAEHRPRESGPLFPVFEACAELRSALPEMGFNPAIEAPFLTTPVSGEDFYLASWGKAAALLGGDPPVLRLVDLSPVSGLLAEPERLDPLADGVCQLAAELWAQGIALALENSKQPLASLVEVIRRTAEGLPAGVPIPRICWDPHNQISQFLQLEDPVETARTIDPELLFEVHFKQGAPGDLWPVVSDGPIDWKPLLKALKENGYRGPALFELPPGLDIWDRLEVSTAYISGILAEVEG